jgi:hypothetical protein
MWHTIFVQVVVHTILVPSLCVTGMILVRAYVFRFTPVWYTYDSRLFEPVWHTNLFSNLCVIRTILVDACVVYGSSSKWCVIRMILVHACVAYDSSCKPVCCTYVFSSSMIGIRL